MEPNIVEDDSPISHVVEGMTVVDSAGERVGTVAEVKMGDPEAVTIEGQTAPEPDGWTMGGRPLDGDGEPEVPPQLVARLLRTGYLKVDTGLLRRNRYVAADQVVRVTEDTVHLSSDREHLVEEG
jgi:hypothetical protein